MATLPLIEPLVSRASGSVGDLVFSHNQHGPYTRDRTAPVDPATVRQLAVRAALSALVTAWRTVLTQTERQAWDVFSLAVRTRTALGTSTNAGGLAMYVRANVPRIQAEEVTLPRVDAAPTLYDHAPFTPVPRVVLNLVDKTFHPFFLESDPWVTETGAAMIFWASLPVATTRNFFKGPYQIAGTLLGSDIRLSSPATLEVPQPAIPPNRVFVRGRVTRADGRLSESFRLPADPVAQVAPLPVSAVFTPLIFPRAFVDVTFDALIKPQPHFPGNWTVRRGNSIWAVTGVAVLQDVVRLAIINVGVQIGLDIVAYTATPPDLNGLLTGLPVLPFTIPLL